jgi:hypothetical protein
MSSARPLRLVEGFYGAEEALTDHAPGAPRWSATLIFSAATVREAQEQADECVSSLAALEQLQLAAEPRDLGEKV